MDAMAAVSRRHRRDRGGRQVMALSKILKFDWDRLLAKVESAEVKRSLNAMRGKANEITVNTNLSMSSMM